MGWTLRVLLPRLPSLSTVPQVTRHQGEFDVHIKRIGVALLAFVLIAAACGSSSKKASSNNNTPTSGAAASCSGVTAGIHIVGEAETTGEGTQAVPYYANGWQLGID